ncbi:MAG: hypothetical protein IJ751_09055 [Oscillospiraceae bacterium]|nr:hypothetical protein [Oscillospiraceae bacterium]
MKPISEQLKLCRAKLPYPCALGRRPALRAKKVLRWDADGVRAGCLGVIDPMYDCLYAECEGCPNRTSDEDAAPPEMEQYG